MNHKYFNLNEKKKSTDVNTKMTRMSKRILKQHHKNAATNKIEYAGKKIQQRNKKECEQRNKKYKEELK